MPAQNGRRTPGRALVEPADRAGQDARAASTVMQRSSLRRIDMTNTILAVEGMTCSSCIAHIKKALAIPGVAGVDVNLAARSVAIVHEPGISGDRLVAVLGAAGYPAQPAQPPSVEPRTAPRRGCCCG